MHGGGGWLVLFRFHGTPRPLVPIELTPLVSLSLSLSLQAWFIKLKITDKTELEGLLDEKAYAAHCEKESGGGN